MDDNKLKQYALNIYNNKRGYTFQKVYSLFPNYASKISFYYDLILYEENIKKTNEQINSISIIKAFQIYYKTQENLLNRLKININDKDAHSQFLANYIEMITKSGLYTQEEINNKLIEITKIIENMNFKGE